MRRIFFLIPILGACVGAIGCDREESIVEYSAPKDAVEAPPVRWTLPAAWKQIGGRSEMRFATIAAAKDDPTLQVTVAQLPPNLPLLPNINRWQKQIGADDLTEEQATQKLQAVDVAGKKVNLIELTGKAQAILAAFVETQDHTWYFKIEGSSEKVFGQKQKFGEFVKSLRFESGDGSPQPTATATATATTTAPAIVPLKLDALTAEIPSTWVALPPKEMRLVGYRASSDAASPEIIGARFRAGAFGSLLDNINRWRGMAGLPSVKDASETPPAHLTVASGQQADVYDFAGAGNGAGNGAKRIRVAMITNGELTYFFRLHGEAAPVGQTQPAFDAFVQSIRFTK